MFSIINYARILNIDPENILNKANNKFRTRFPKRFYIFNKIVIIIYRRYDAETIFKKLRKTIFGTAFLKTSGVLENLPEGLQIIDNQDGTGALVGQFDYGQSGDYAIVVQVYDGTFIAE